MESLHSLPEDETEVSKQDQLILDQLFGSQKESVWPFVLFQLKRFFVVFCIVFLFFQPFVDQVFEKSEFFQKNHIVKNLIKALIFTLFLWIVFQFVINA